MPGRSDIVVYTADAQPLIDVEVKGGKESSPERANAVRNGLPSNSPGRNARFFALAYRSGLFLWEGSSSPHSLPSWAPLKDVLRDYARSVKDPDENLRIEGLSLVLHSWLDDLAAGIRKPKPASEADQLLVRLGIHEQMRLGRVTTEPSP